LLGIKRTTRTTPTAALEILLGLPPLSLQLEAEARAGIYRLQCNKQWKPRSIGFGHAYMTKDMKKGPILQMGSDRMLPIHVYEKFFAVRFPDRSEWREGFRPDRKGGLIWYTDGSKTNKGTGAGVYCNGTRRKLISFGLGRTQQCFRQKYMPLRHVLKRR
jgi:hypothetical protein